MIYRLLVSAFPLLVLLVVAHPPSYSQQRVSLGNTHERVLCIVPMVGRGTDDDPRRPMFAPLYERGSTASRSGIIAYTYQESDDGHLALVEFVALDRAALEPILSARSAAVRVFEKGNATRAEIQAAFRLFKRDFDIGRFRVNVP